MKKIILILSLMISMSANATSVKPSAAHEVITLFYTHISAKLLEYNGIDTEDISQLNAPIRYTALATGDADYSLESFSGNHANYLKEYEGIVEPIGVLFPNVLDGFAVDRLTAEKLNIKSVADFQRPEVIESFDSNNNGKAEFVGCQPGWGCEPTTVELFTTLGIAESIDYTHASYDVLIAEAIAKHKSGQPVFFYAWTPHQSLGAIDYVWINTGDGYPLVKNASNCVTKDCTFMFLNEQLIVANTDWIKENQKAVDLLGKFSMNLDEVNQLAARIYFENLNSQGVIDLADQWIENNPNFFSEITAAAGY